ncbi:MAG: cytochrome c-type biogenesis protein CcmH [Pseudomonadota bacterium]|nr:cytochrome c-type biogenesis protein CcmH [Pseudomonadota bacterium]
MKRSLLGILLVLMVVVSQAMDFKTDKTYKNIIKNIRCPVCQSQSLAESQTQEAIDLRKKIERWLINGKSEKEILETIEKDYGQDKLLKPKFNTNNAILWALPYVVCAWCFLSRKSKT